MKSKISIIVPIYNMEKHLSKCINSIINQSYKNIEIILVNDGSKDKSINICNQYSKKYSNIIVIDKNNEGVSVARNVGIEKATGDWIMFLDPDDTIEKNIVEILLKNVDVDTDIISCSCKVDDGNSITNAHFFPSGFSASSSIEKRKLYLQLIDMNYEQNNAVTAIGVPWGKLYRHSFIKKFNIMFEPNLKRMQDNIFNMYAIYYCKKFKYIDEPLYIYNYEHMNNSIYSFNSKDIVITKNKIIYRKKAIDDLKLRDDVEIFNYYLKESAIHLTKIIKDILFDKNSSDNYFQKRNKIKSLYNSDITNDIRNNKLNYKIYGSKQFLIVLLLRLHFFELLILVFYIYNSNSKK